jgi:hypothetical protein
MTDTTLNISPVDIESLEQLYRLRERSQVLEFINKHPFLLPVLLEAPAEIRQYFPDSQLFLEVVPDAEIPDWVHLVLSILMTLEPNDAVARLNQLDNDWSRSLPYQVHQKFFTILEYPDEF